MALIRIINNADSEIIVWKMEESIDFLKSNVNFSDELESVFNSITSPKRATEWLTSKYIINKYLGNNVVVTYNSTRRPMLIGSSQQISVSHNEAYCCVMFSKKVCGVDIESSNRNFGRVVSRFLSQSERDMLPTNFYHSIAWCAKEALYKKLRVGEIDFRDDFRITQIEEDSKICIKYLNDIHTLQICQIDDLIICYCD